MFKFACGSIEGLTLTQKRETLKALKLAIKADAARAREAKSALKLQKVENAEIRRMNAIAKAQAKLDKLLSKPVGTKAIKANRKPSKVTTLQVEAREANEIAKKFASKKTA
jgi:hypothetical protein